MTVKDEWKNMGVNIGHAFKNVGKAVVTTGKVVAGKEESTNEDGKSTVGQSWTDVGHGFGEAGKSIGKAASATAKSVFCDDYKEEVDAKPKEEEKKKEE